MNGAAIRPPQAGRERVSWSRAHRGVISGLAGAGTAAIIDSVGVGAAVLAQSPRGLAKMGRELWQSDASLPSKALGSLLLPRTALAATAAAARTAGIAGVILGFRDGYQEGYAEAFRNALTTVRDLAQEIDGAMDAR